MTKCMFIYNPISGKSKKIVKKLLKVVIDDIEYEISCTIDYVNFLKKEINRYEKNYPNRFGGGNRRLGLLCDFRNSKLVLPDDCTGATSRYFLYTFLDCPYS